jgi:TRAP-type C4-dicarboxylate transport system substrate-binding protein
MKPLSQRLSLGGSGRESRPTSGALDVATPFFQAARSGDLKPGVERMRRRAWAELRKRFPRHARGRWPGRAALFLVVAAAVPALVAVSPLSAAEKSVRINLGTLAPRGSTYHQSLQAMAEKWKQAPGGGVRLVIYPDGTQGGETDMVRLMRVGSLQAGLLTAVGLGEIEQGVAGLQSMPMMFRDFDEFEFVNDKLRPMVEKRLADKGFVVLFWVDAGWVRYFSKTPMVTPEEMKRRKVFVWAGNVAQVDIMKKHGYNPVPLETGEILPGLRTGLVNCVPAPPVFALAAQIDTSAPHMLGLRWAPLVGACVVKKDSWDKIPAEAREPMLKAAGDAGREIRANSRKESDESVAAMKKRGLTVDELTPEQEARWRAEVEEIYPDIRGRIVPAEIFDEVQRLLKDYRARGTTK